MRALSFYKQVRGVIFAIKSFLLMADINSRATVELVINGKNAEAQLDALKRRAEELRKKMDKATQAGNLKGAERFQRQLANVEKQLARVQAKTVDVTTTLKRLDKASLADLNKSLKALQAGLQGMERGTAAWDRQVEAIKRVKGEIREANAALAPAPEVVDRVNDFFNKYQMAIMGAIAAITGLIMAGKKAVSDFAAMDQEMANVRKFTGMDEGQVSALNEEFKKIDTRTPREDLNKLAQEAGRLGKTSQEDVLGFVRAADKINVALDDLGEGATLTLSKLTGIFGDEKRLGTEKALLSVGSVINELSQNCSASAPYLAEFASRLGGVGSQAGLTVQQIMAYAAVLDSNNAALEASATALSQVVVRIYQQPAKYAKVAGLNVAKFTKLVKSDMNAALLEFLSALDRAGGMDNLSPMFKDMGENGARAIAALSTLAGHISEVRDQQSVANKAFAQAISIDKEFEVQNTTVQASLDKAKNRVKELAISLGEKLQPVMRLCISSSTLILKVLSFIVNVIYENKKAFALLAVSIAAYNIQIHAAAIRTAAITAVTKGWAFLVKTIPATVGLARVALAALTNSVQYFTNGLQVNYAMQDRWRKAVSALSAAGPQRVFMLAVTAGIALSQIIGKLIAKYNQLGEVQKMMNKIKEEAAVKVEEERIKIVALINAANDESKSQEERRRICERLNEIIPDMNAQIDAQTNAFKYSKDALDKYIKSLQRYYEIQGAKEQLKEYGKERAKLVGQKAQLEKEKQDLKKEQNQFIANSSGSNNFNYSTTSGGGMPATVNLSVLFSGSSEAADIKIRKKDNEIAAVDEKMNALFRSYGVMELTSGDEEKEPDTDATGKSYSSSGKKKGRGAKPDKFKAEKAWRDEQIAEAEMKYVSGEMWEIDYQDRLLAIEVEYNEKRLQNTKITEEEKKKVTAELYKARIKQQEKFTANTIEIENRRHAANTASLRQEFIDGKIDKRTYDIETEKDEILHQQNLAEFAMNGSKEKADALAKLEELQFNQAQKRQEQLESLRQKYSKEYALKSAAEKMKLELALLDELNRLKLMKEVEYQALAAAIREKYLSDFLPESAKPDKSEEQKAEEQKNKDLERLAKLRAENAFATEQDYLEARERVNKKYEKDKLARARQAGNEFSAMLIDLYSAFKDLGEDDGDEGLPGRLKKIAAAAQASFAFVSACMQQYQEYSKAALEIEVARIERRYNAEASLAEGNVYKQKQAEQKKQREIAKAKSEAARKNFAMQVIQAVAQTAINGLNAYGAALQVGGVAGLILAPIAAAMAVAAGMMQVATLKKQQKASEAQGYMQGGFTPKGREDREVGVVHAGEWVAPRRLVDSPTTRPVIDMLERFRLTNRMPSLSFADVSRTVTAPATAAAIAAPAAAPATASRQDPETTARDQRINDTLDRLTARLNEPFVTINTVTGDYGSKKVEDEYKRLMRNKSKS